VAPERSEWEFKDNLVSTSFLQPSVGSESGFATGFGLGSRTVCAARSKRFTLKTVPGTIYFRLISIAD